MSTTFYHTSLTSFRESNMNLKDNGASLRRDAWKPCALSGLLPNGEAIDWANAAHDIISIAPSSIIIHRGQRKDVIEEGCYSIQEFLDSQKNARY